MLAIGDLCTAAAVLANRSLQACKGTTVQPCISCHSSMGRIIVQAAFTITCSARQMFIDQLGYPHVRVISLVLYAQRVDNLAYIIVGYLAFDGLFAGSSGALRCAAAPQSINSIMSMCNMTFWQIKRTFIIFALHRLVLQAEVQYSEMARLVMQCRCIRTLSSLNVALYCPQPSAKALLSDAGAPMPCLACIPGGWAIRCRSWSSA